MKFSKRSAVLVATGIVGGMALTACGGGTGSGDSGDSADGGAGRVVFGEPSPFPENLFPFISAGNSTATQDIIGRVLPSAFNVAPDFTVAYDANILASEPTLDTSSGRQVDVYKINDAAVWSDGTPITADDFAFTWKVNRSNDPKSGGCDSVLSTNGYANIASVEGSDGGKTVTVTYNQPYADWQSLFTAFLPAHLMDESDPAALCKEITAGWPVGDGLPSDISAGPFQLTRDNIDVGGQIAVLTPNPKWWGTKAKLAQLVIQEVGNDPTTTVQGIQSGELGVVYPQPQLDLVDQLAKLKPNVQSTITAGLSYEHLDFNTTDPILSDVRVRQAFALALDRQEIVDQTVDQFAPGTQVLNNRLYVNNQPEYRDNAPAQYRTQDVEGAKALLQQAGWTLGADGIFAKNGQKLSLRIDTTVNNPLRKTAIEVMIPMLKKAGIDASFNANPDIFGSADDPTSLEAGGFQVAMFAWYTLPFVSANQSYFSSPANGLQQNYTRAGTAEIDGLMKQMVSESDAATVTDLANRVDSKLWDQMATIPLFQKPTIIAYRNDIQNVQDNSSQTGPLWNAETWAVKE